MGSTFEITVVDDDAIRANKNIDAAVAEIKRIERLISSWDMALQTSEINKNAGAKAVRVKKELFQLIERAKSISKLTDGAFDISYASMDRIWKFDESMGQMPSDKEIKLSVAKVGAKSIELDAKNNTVFLKKKGMKIGFGAIGKGYAADKAKTLLQERGVSAGIINASGDMNAWGSQPDGTPWRVAIRNPMNKNKVFALMPLQNKAVVTSGNYEKFVRFNGVRYAHIIDPRTGYPATELISVTVFAPKAEFADALATAVFVMGKEAGIDRINQIPNVDCIIIDHKGIISTSENIELNKI
ncbi:MAG: FAD:protein FMN transferase [Flavobacteriaceae bacterium]|nr:FAD:protein FMN transferase [Flavobacteriaceae bacterium]